jgi:hypothetical protein
MLASIFPLVLIGKAICKTSVDEGWGHVETN